MPFYKNVDNESMLLQPQPTLRQCTLAARCRANAARKGFVTMCCLLFTLLFIMALFAERSVEITINLKVDKIFRNTSDNFLSVALDTSLIQERWSDLDIRSTKFLQMVRYLSPGYLRVGGTTADRLIFKANSTEPTINASYVDVQLQRSGMSYRARPLYGLMDGDTWSYADTTNINNKPIDTFTMTGDDWIMINNFAKSAGFKLLFDLNVLLRDNDSNWNSENARELIRFSDQHNFEVDWQLGNEPNSFPHVFNISVNGSQLGKDFHVLNNILKSFPRYRNSLLVGPDVTRPKFLKDSSIHFLKDFLNSANNSINAVTWHQYYLNGHTAVISDFLNPDTLNMLYKQILAVRLTVRNAQNASTRTPIWLSETGSAYGGGAWSLSDRFVAGFLWLDKLGLAARMGIDVVVRQSLYHGYYSLLAEKTFNPTPDWWLSVIYKTFVGRGVIQASTFIGSVRLYSHCTPPNVSNGTITLFGLNMLRQTAYITVGGLTAPLDPAWVAAAYILTAEDGLRSKNVMLNGRTLRINKDGTLPPFKPKYISYKSSLTLPPLSMGFFVLNGIEVPACRM